MEKRHINVRVEDFQLPDKIRQLIAYIDIYLDNFPHKYNQIKDRLANNSYDMLYCAYKANKTDNVYVKLDLIDELYANAQVIEYLINLSYEKGIINQKRVNKFGRSLGTISAMLTGWKKTSLEEKRKLEKNYMKIYQSQIINTIKKGNPDVTDFINDTISHQKSDENKENIDKTHTHSKAANMEFENPKTKQLEQKYKDMELKCPKPTF